MAKKIKNNKLIRQTNDKPAFNNNDLNKKSGANKSVFGNFAQKIQIAKQKRIEKLSDTKNRVMSKKKQSQMMRIPSQIAKSNKFNKFSLLDDADQNQPKGLTHRGASLDKVKHFNDMHFDNDDMADDSANFDDMHGQVNFHGFQENENQRKDQNDDPDRRKSKNQIYKQIIEKSKMHKRDRQQQYEQNFNAAVQLDQQFPQFVSKLKFRNNDAKVRDKIQKTDVQYERLMNQLKDDERVVANRVVDNNKKGTEKIRKKKNEQLNELLKNDSEDEEDIRGWVKGLNSDQQGSEQGDEDQIDDVALSSGEQDKDEEQDQDGQEDGSQQQQKNEDQDYQDEEKQQRKGGIIIADASSSNQEQQNDEQVQDQSEEQDNQQQEQQIIPPKNKKLQMKNKQIQKYKENGKNNRNLHKKNMPQQQSRNISKNYKKK